MTAQRGAGVTVNDPTTEDLAHSTQVAEPITCPRCGVTNSPTLGSGSGPHVASARIDALTSGKVA